ncbi:MAG: hypothetical protein R3189_09335 [Thiomicrorhabdus chilensis]|uniref:hypothetical protein n=1 Tax=Thiomicrorhabdus chilensis TaxID=63656 RepID=UPI00299E671D|nr:hypothetical protein [Thiomicrorhabdus chilensis]MDX1348436.1 hypothetical protein [Thiomicrorhabdus chilensis]
MAITSTQQNLQTCLEFIDERLDNKSDRSIQIAEMIILDIKNLTRAYPDALRTGQLKAHLERVRTTQLNWVNQLHGMISDHSEQDLNVEVINALKGFVDTLNQHTSIDSLSFEAPESIAKHRSKQLNCLNPQEYELLMGQPSLFGDSTRH